MKHAIFTFYLVVFLANLSTAQGFFNYADLTKDERDSLQKGIVTPEMTVKFERLRQKDKVRQDSIVKNQVLNHPIPDFDARDTAGILHRPSMYKGRVWVIHVWDFWDNSLRYEIPPLNTLVDSLRGEGVEVLSFLHYSLGEGEKKYLMDYPIRFPMVENSEKFGNELLGTYFPRPFVLIIDKKGICRYFYDHIRLHGTKQGHPNELLEENRRNHPTYDFMEKVKTLLRE